MIKKIIQKIGNSFQSSALDLPFDSEKIEKILGYSFREHEYLQHALKHRSILSVTNEENYESNERLELLGDAVLELISTEHLYFAYPKYDEGTLSKMRAVLVSRQVLGKIVAEMGLGEFLLLNKGEEKTGGRTRPSNLANLYEAILGAIYLDGGYNPSKKFVQNTLLKNKEEWLTTERYFNYKSDLLEYSQAKGWGAPLYEVKEAIGPDHDKSFRVSVKISGHGTDVGEGKSKKKAEQNAAKELLLRLKKDGLMEMKDSKF